MKENISVIPGRAEGASPESIATDQSVFARSAFQSRRLVFMDPGLRPAAGPGMTAACALNTSSLKRRGEQQAALGPQLVLAARELERRAHADGAFVGLA